VWRQLSAVLVKKTICDFCAIVFIPFDEDDHSG
jgi:hypothetical protein